MVKIGIIAGNGKLPLLSAKTARQQGHEIVVCAIKGETDNAIATYANELTWVRLGEIKKVVKFFKHHAVTNVCFVGKITKTSIFTGHIKPDIDMIMLVAKLKDRKDDTILGAICDYLEAKGLHVVDSTTYLGECLPGSGMLSKGRLSKGQRADIDFGFELAKESARLDIGQSVVVKDKAVLAIEAIEGTDEAIRRGAALGHGDVVLVKVAKPHQDMRFDVPTIGPTTVDAMIQAGARVLAFEASKTIVVEKDDVVAMANKHGILIVGI